MGRKDDFTLCITEHGVLMLSSVLKSEKAVSVNIRIMRTFIRMRELLINHKDLIPLLGVVYTKSECGHGCAVNKRQKNSTKNHKKGLIEWF